MISSVELDTSPISPGETRFLRAFSDRPVHVTVLCYFSDPPPPGYRPCTESKEVWVKSGDTVEISASHEILPTTRKFLDITVKDASGDSRTFRLRVASRSGGAETQRVMARG